MSSMKKNMPASRTDRTMGLCGALVFAALCVSLTGCPEEKHPAAAAQPAASQPASPPAPQPAPAPPPAAATTTQPATAAATPTAPPPPPPVMAFDDAVAKATHAVFTNAPAP